MEIEEKIFYEISNSFTDEGKLDKSVLSQINKLIIYQSVQVADKEKTDKDAINYIENKLYDLFTKNK
jgi:septum formation inhibitor-activating ATPase MinD